MAVNHTPKRRQDALKVMRETAETNDGVPVWARCESIVGVSRSTLRRWWAQRNSDATGELHVFRREDAPVTPSDEEPEPADPLTSEPLVYYAHAFARDRRAYLAAQERGQFGAAKGFADRMDASYERVRSALADERKRGKGMSREEVEGRLRTLAASMAPADAVILVEGLRARGIA